MVVSSRPRRAPGLVRMPRLGITVIDDLFHAGMRGPITPVTTTAHRNGCTCPVVTARVSVTAYAIEDTETQRDLLSDQITAQVLPDWSGRPWAD